MTDPDAWIAEVRIYHAIKEAIRTIDGENAQSNENPNETTRCSPVQAPAHSAPAEPDATPANP